MEILIKKIISNITYIDASIISNKTKFRDLGFDNIDMAELILVLEEKLELTATVNMYNAKTIAELIEQIEELNKLNKLNF